MGGAMRTYTAVVNPAAGGDAAARLLPVARALREAGAEVSVEYSRSLEHAADLARTAAGRGDVVVAVGGDGMVGCLAGALAGSDAVLGILPAGRGNDFARQLGLPSDSDEITAVLRDAEPGLIDLVRAEDGKGQEKIIAGSVYCGIDAVANKHINASRLPGSLAYYLGPLRAVSTWRMPAYRVTVDGTTHDEPGYTVVAANSGFYGFGRHIAPDASLDDGLLDVVIIRKAPRRLFFAVMKELEHGTHIQRPIVEVLRGREVRIEADRDLPYGADGELISTLPVTVSVMPGALSVLGARPSD